MSPEHPFQPYGLPHLTVIFLTIVLPFALAAVVRRTKSRCIERTIVGLLSGVLILNYVAYLVFVRSHGIVNWQQMLPLQLCDWGIVVVIVAMWTGNQRWFEVAYFWGIGGTLQAVLTPNLTLWFSRLAIHQLFYFALRHNCRRRLSDTYPPLPALSHVDRAHFYLVRALFCRHHDRGRANRF
jgi:hypothetical integral membrane protein (TIGR02206 family)